MLAFLYRFAERYATGRNILIGLGLIVFFNIVLGQLPAWLGVPDAFGSSGPPDLWYSYEGEALYTAIGQWSESGRKIYPLNSLLTDNLYALTYGVTYLLLLWWLYSKSLPDKKWWKPWVVILPLFTAFMDWVENFSISKVCATYPNHSIGAEIAPWASWLKWNGAAGVLLLFLLGLGALVVGKVK